MGMWVLILTIGGATSQSGLSVSQHDYTSWERCMAAASLWLKEVVNARGITKAQCMPK